MPQADDSLIAMLVLSHYRQAKDGKFKFKKRRKVDNRDETERKATASAAVGVKNKALLSFDEDVDGGS